MKRAWYHVFIDDAPDVERFAFGAILFTLVFPVYLVTNYLEARTPESRLVVLFFSLAAALFGLGIMLRQVLGWRAIDKARDPGDPDSSLKSAMWRCFLLTSLHHANFIAFLGLLFGPLMLLVLWLRPPTGSERTPFQVGTAACLLAGALSLAASISLKRYILRHHPELKSAFKSSSTHDTIGP